MCKDAGTRGGDGTAEAVPSQWLEGKRWIALVAPVGDSG